MTKNKKEGTPFPKRPEDTEVRMEAWRRTVADGFAVAPRPDAILVWLQDLLAARQFRDQYRQEQKVPLTYAPLFIKTCALALKKSPQCNVMSGRGKIVIPSSID